MFIYNIQFKGSQEDTRHAVRAATAAAAAELFIAAYLQDKLPIFDHAAATRTGILDIHSISTEPKGEGVFIYDQPEVNEIELVDLPSWRIAVGNGFEPGEDVDDWLQRQDTGTPQP